MIKVLISGNAGVGKTTWMNKLVDEGYGKMIDGDGEHYQFQFSAQSGTFNLCRAQVDVTVMIGHPSNFPKTLLEYDAWFVMTTPHEDTINTWFRYAAKEKASTSQYKCSLYKIMNKMCRGSTKIVDGYCYVQMSVKEDFNILTAFERVLLKFCEQNNYPISSDLKIKQPEKIEIEEAKSKNSEQKVEKPEQDVQTLRSKLREAIVKYRSNYNGRDKNELVGNINCMFYDGNYSKQLKYAINVFDAKYESTGWLNERESMVDQLVAEILEIFSTPKQRFISACERGNLSIIAHLWNSLNEDDQKSVIKEAIDATFACCDNDPEGVVLHLLQFDHADSSIKEYALERSVKQGLYQVWEVMLKIFPAKQIFATRQYQLQDPYNEALMWACSKGHTKFVKWLLRENKDRTNVNFQCKHSVMITPLTQAACKDHVEIMQILIDAGANVNTKNSDGYCGALIGAISGFYPGKSYSAKTIRLLLVNGADIHTCEDGVFLDVVRKGLLGMVRYMLKTGSTINKDDGTVQQDVISSDVTLQKAMNIAQIRRNSEMIQLLREFGAKFVKTHMIKLSDGRQVVVSIEETPTYAKSDSYGQNKDEPIHLNIQV